MQYEFDPDRDIEDKRPEMRDAADDDTERARLLRTYLKDPSDDTTAFIKVIHQFPNLVGKESIDLAKLFMRLKDVGEWSLCIYRDYILKYDRNATLTAKEYTREEGYEITRDRVLRIIDTVRQAFMSD